MKGSEPMMPAEALASDDIALIFCFIFLRLRSTRARLPSASLQVAARLLLDGDDDDEEVHFRQRHAIEQDVWIASEVDLPMRLLIEHASGTRT